jgi:hypothetical protein
MKEIRILPAVLQDIAEAAAWYDEDGYSGLGDRFLATFYNFIPLISERGNIYRKAYLDFRKVIIKPFPYAVYFRLHEDIWIITLVIHAARRPSLARRILRERK